MANESATSSGRELMNYRVLRALYNCADGHRSQIISRAELAQSAGLTQPQVAAAVEALESMGLVRRTDEQGDVHLRTAGVAEIEQSHADPTRATSHFPVAVIQHFNAVGGGVADAEGIEDRIRAQPAAPRRAQADRPASTDAPPAGSPRDGLFPAVQLVEAMMLRADETGDRKEEFLAMLLGLREELTQTHPDRWRVKSWLLGVWHCRTRLTWLNTGVPRLAMEIKTHGLDVGELPFLSR